MRSVYDSDDYRRPLVDVEPPPHAEYNGCYEPDEDPADYVKPPKGVRLA